MDQIYMDHNATTPVKPAVAEAVADVLANVGNPSSVHRHGRLARRLVEDARQQVAALVGADPSQVTFTSGGTEANQLALQGCGRDRVLVSAVEHPSVLVADLGAWLIPVDGDGRLELAALQAKLLESDVPALVSVMLANNETGVIQPVSEAAAIAHDHGALFHCDAVQAAGKIAFDLAALDADLLSISAHKMGGPMGVGALINRPGVKLTALVRGGGQERGLRSGTENVSGIIGFGKAAELALEGRADIANLAAGRDRLEARVREIAPGTRFFGAGAERLPNTSCLTMPGVDSETQVMALDLAGISVSAGSACSSGKVQASHVLEAMGGSGAENAIRVSLGWSSRDDDIDKFLEAWGSLYARKGSGREQAAPAA